jgi:alpha-1,3-rhamnosyltransferase
MKVISQKNTGNVGQNLNTLLANSTGKYLAIQSCDDAITDDCMPAKIAVMEKDENVQFVFSEKEYYIDNEGKLIREEFCAALKEKNPPKNISEFYDVEYEKLGTVYLQGTLWRRSIVDSVGQFDTDLLIEDMALRSKIELFMMKHSNMTFASVPGHGIKYRLHTNNLHKNTVRQVVGVAQILERYFPDRPIPAMLVVWVKVVLEQKNKPLSSAIEMFTVSDKMRALLDNREIVKAISDNYNPPKKLRLKEWLFRKIRHWNGLREIYILGIIYIRYWKKEKAV